MTREEAINKIKEWDFHFNNESDREVLETLIPELRESENKDKELMKILKEMVHYNIADSIFEYYHLNKEYFESWLERQRFQNSWTEDDEYNLNELVKTLFEIKCLTKEYYHYNIKWFNSLKRRLKNELI